MENNENLQNNNSSDVHGFPQNTMQSPAPQKGEPENTKAGNWVKALVILFGISIFASLIIIFTPAKKTEISKTEKTTLSSILDWQKKGPGIGWVEVRGVISEGYSSSPFERSSGKIAKQIKILAEKKDVKSIVIDINSPGGTIAAVQEIYDAIIYVRKEKKKPVIALFKDVAASGGYYIACACDKIVSFPGTLTGSIGVIFQAGDLTKLLDKIGVDLFAIKSGKHKDIGSAYRKMTNEEQKILQDIIDDYYEQFLDVVSVGRNIAKENLKELADGRIFSGSQAYKSKLIDDLGGTQKAIKIAVKMGKIKGKPQIIRARESLQDIFSYITLEMKSKIFPVSELENLKTPQFAYLWVY